MSILGIDWRLFTPEVPDLSRVRERKIEGRYGYRSG